MQELYQRQLPYYVLGAGTNSLVSDTFWKGAVVALHAMCACTVQDEKISCQAGVLNNDIVALALEHELEGVGWMHFLPGQIGATTRMNARCYGGEISKIVKEVKTISARGETCFYRDASKVFRGYKDTLFMHNGDIISEVVLALHTGKKTQIQAVMAQARDDRFSKGQFLYPSCGCVFKNDYSVGIPSGVLLEKAEVRKFSQKRVFISKKHANFIFNAGATSEEIVALSLQMRDRVYAEFGVWLQYEMEFLGEFPPSMWKEIKRTELHDWNNKNLQALQAKRDVSPVSSEF